MVRQEHASDCGLAALSAVLRFWGVPDEREQIEASLWKSEARLPGALAGELRDYARSRSLSAYVFEGAFDDLRHELEVGRPAIVGVHKPLRSGEALAHYEVVVGYHAAAQRVLTMDPAHGFRRNSVSGFIQEWRGSNQLILVVFPPSPDFRASR
jgi:predicted double-glycine peptidase